MPNSYGSEATLKVADQQYTIHRLDAVAKLFSGVERLPYSLKILLENVLRTQGSDAEGASSVEAIATWDASAQPKHEIAFTPSRVLLQDFTGVPAIVDLAAMRDAMKRLGGNPSEINPLQPAELVIDHSVQVDHYGTADALQKNTKLEFSRNGERYRFLRWGQRALADFRVVPPQTGIVHQINLEHLARVVFTDKSKPQPNAYPDTLVGTDSHTTMVNGLGVLGWGVGGIEAEAAMLGQAISMLIPQVVGFEMTGRLPEGATATDLVLTVTSMLRERNVVGKFVEFFGEGLSSLSLADRATIANMAPEYGATCGIFPIDDQTLRYMRLSGRPEQQIKLTEAYAKEQGLFHSASSPKVVFTDTMTLDLGTVEACISGPKRPQDRVNLGGARTSFQGAMASLEPDVKSLRSVDIELDGQTHSLSDGAIVIAAITSCTNTSNPALIFGAGLLARKAVARGLTTKAWVKTSLAPGSKVATKYLNKAGLLDSLEKLGFYLAGYGCTSCIGNSGPLLPPISKAINDNDLVVSAVVSGNRNFEGRVHPEVRTNYLASPPLVVAFALAGRIDIDLTKDPLGTDAKGQPVYLRDIWPSNEEIFAAIDSSLDVSMFLQVYRDVFEGDERWNAIDTPDGDLYQWDPDSTYVRDPPYFVGMTRTPDPIRPVKGARVLALLGDSITTDHISPAGTIAADSPAGAYLVAHGVKREDFNSYGSRRGNHEVMMRGTFGNVRLRNQLAPGTEGGFTRHFPDGEVTTIFEASEHYRNDGVPLLVIAGKEYGTGSSRDWAAKGTLLLGVRAVLAESYERIHRSNLIGMGVVPLQFAEGEGAKALGLTGEEFYELVGLEKMIDGDLGGGRELSVRVTGADGATREFVATIRIDTPQELRYFQHGGILHYVLRQLLEDDNAEA